MSALAALLASRGATRLGGARTPTSRRGCRAACEVVVLESPLPSELRRWRPRGVPVIVLAERAEPADALAAAQLGARALLDEERTLAELSLR